jgi:nitroreductase
MELKVAIERRVSVRSFSNDQVKQEDLMEMVRLAGLAPSINNFQPWSFLGITSRDTLNTIAQLVSNKLMSFPVKSSELARNVKSQVEYFSTFFTDAPAVIGVVLEEYETVWENGIQLSHEEINKMRNYPDLQSTGACIQNILLAATDMGYGSCWLSGPMVAKDEIQSLLGILPPSKLISFVAIGRPAHEHKPKIKMNMAERLRFI